MYKTYVLTKNSDIAFMKYFKTAVNIFLEGKVIFTTLMSTLDENWVQLQVYE